jgi:hypothetical protein
VSENERAEKLEFFFLSAQTPKRSLFISFHFKTIIILIIILILINYCEEAEIKDIFLNFSNSTPKGVKDGSLNFLYFLLTNPFLWQIIYTRFATINDDVLISTQLRMK